MLHRFLAFRGMFRIGVWGFNMDFLLNILASIIASVLVTSFYLQRVRRQADMEERTINGACIDNSDVVAQTIGQYSGAGF
jgi:hypothetical protein